MAQRPPGRIVYRNTARVLPIDSNGKILLMHGWDPAVPDSPFWFTIGGAAEPGEDLQVQVRETTSTALPLTCPQPHPAKRRNRHGGHGR